jgi:hypothetical protein
VADFRYPAFIMRQSAEGKPLVFFAAPAVDIELWAGVPQRRRLEETETFGFQRESKDARVDEIASFFADPENVVQNPLLAAEQDPSVVRFEPSGDSEHFGTLIIDHEDLQSLPLLELLQRLAARLRQRIPALANQHASEDQIARIKQAVNDKYSSDDFGSPESELGDEDAHSDTDEPQLEEPSPSDIGAALLAEETSVVEFYTEIDARIKVLESAGKPWIRSDFMGFTHEAVLAYLLPVVLVDGQHRLRGAVKSATQKADEKQNEDAALALIENNVAADDIADSLRKQYSPSLPVSLLMDPRPSEHVFQFVVVNQKATPLAPALLGTIVSTSLGSEELDPIADRLRSAGIQLDDSRAIAYLTRAPESPFRNLVQTGMGGDGQHLQWMVLQGLVRIFREFTGGKLYGYGNNDYAAMWSRKYLFASKFVEEADSLDEKKALWGRPEGPWRDVFIRFFTLVRNKFSSDDPNSRNFWGSTRNTNLYNKISLTILAADFFKFLNEKDQNIHDIEDVDEAFARWTDGLNAGYFDRLWPVEGTKKDSIGVRNKWALTWVQYRENPVKLPPLTSYKA